MGVFEDGDEAGGEGSEGAAGPAVIVIELWWYSASLAPQEVNIINFIFLMKLNRTLACTQISNNSTGTDYQAGHMELLDWLQFNWSGNRPEVTGWPVFITNFDKQSDINRDKARCGDCGGSDRDLAMLGLIWYNLYFVL